MKMMRKFVLIAVLTAAFLSNLNAQLSIGAKAGINVANIITDDGYKKNGLENVILPHFGAMLEIGMGEHFALQPEANFIQKGFNNSVNDVKWQFNYLDLHLMLKYKFNLGPLRAYVDAGPTAGYALNASKADNDVDFDLEKMKQAELGIAGGLGLGFDLGPGVLFVDGRYMMSLSNLNEDDSVRGTWRHAGFDYTLGYLLRLGGD